jgi:hypothetical protein
MIKEDIILLRKKLENQISSNCSYDDVYKTSVEIDRLLIKYYEEYGLAKKV